MVINITVGEDDDPQLIFESLNSTGVDLTEGDKIRNYVLMGLPKDKQVEIQNGIRSALGCSRLSFGSDERLQKQLALSPGAVSPFGVVNDEDHDVVVVLDKELKKTPGLIGFHPNVNTAFVWLTFDGLMTFLRAMGNPVYCIEL